jgi:hypothetical protein
VLFRCTVYVVRWNVRCTLVRCTLLYVERFTLYVIATRRLNIIATRRAKMRHALAILKGSLFLFYSFTPVAAGACQLASPSDWSCSTTERNRYSTTERNRFYSIYYTTERSRHSTTERNRHSTTNTRPLNVSQSTTERNRYYSIYIRLNVIATRRQTLDQ